MFVFYKGKHTSRRSTVGIWSEVRVYRAPVHEHIARRRSTVGQLPDNRLLWQLLAITWVNQKTCQKAIRTPRK